MCTIADVYTVSDNQTLLDLDIKLKKAERVDDSLLLITSALNKLVSQVEEDKDVLFGRYITGKRFLRYKVVF